MSPHTFSKKVVCIRCHFGDWMHPRRKMQSGKSKCQKPTRKSLVSATGFSETTDLRTGCIYIAPALQSTYSVQPTSHSKISVASKGVAPESSISPVAKHSAGLDIGTQQLMLEAARQSNKYRRPLNTLLTVRWGSLRAFDDMNPLFHLDVPERIKNIVERIRTWLTRPNRQIGAYYIWVRESSPSESEHWHIALHLPETYRVDFAAYIAAVLGEPLLPQARPASQRTRGEFACSQWTSWHLAAEEPTSNRYFKGRWLAAYLGKGEPSQRIFRDTLVPNVLKPVRGREFGGDVTHDRFDAPQGRIVGTTTRVSRFDISRNLKH